jgi:hypothetical protein
MINQPTPLKSLNGHGGARPGSGRPRGHVPKPIRVQAHEFVVATFQNPEVGLEIRIQAAIALMNEPDGLGPALDRTQAGTGDRLPAKAKPVIITTGTPSFRQVMAALKRPAPGESQSDPDTENKS